MLGFQLRLNHLREFHQNPMNVFFCAPLYNFRVKSARVEINVFDPKFFEDPFGSKRNNLKGFPSETTKKNFSSDIISDTLLGVPYWDGKLVIRTLPLIGRRETIIYFWKAQSLYFLTMHLILKKNIVKITLWQIEKFVSW